MQHAAQVRCNLQRTMLSKKERKKEQEMCNCDCRGYTCRSRTPTKVYSADYAEGTTLAAAFYCSDLATLRFSTWEVSGHLICSKLIASMGNPARLRAHTTPSSFFAVVRKYSRMVPNESTSAWIKSPGLKQCSMTIYTHTCHETLDSQCWLCNECYRWCKVMLQQR